MCDVVAELVDGHLVVGDALADGVESSLSVGDACVGHVDVLTQL